MIIVTNETQFKDAITQQEPEIVIANDITLMSPTNISYTVSISGEQPGVSIFWGRPIAGSQNMLVITSSGELTMESIILDAQMRDGTLVWVNGGIFNMNSGVILRNLVSTTAQNAVTIGSLTSTAGGRFNMNAGLITGVDAGDAAVLSAGGVVVMDNDAVIKENNTGGVTLTETVTGHQRATLVMKGNSCISDNRAKFAGGGVVAVNSEVIMGVDEGDTPKIQRNSSPHHSGGLYLTTSSGGQNVSTLNILFGSEVSDNYAAEYAGGIGARNTTVYIGGDAAIKNNKSESDAGGLLLAADCDATLADEAQICGNTASGRGGGVFISTESELSLLGSPKVFGNTAAQGNGVYKSGAFNLADSPQIQDGLFFDSPQDDPFAGSAPESGEAYIIVGEQPGERLIILEKLHEQLTEKDSLTAPKGHSAAASPSAPAAKIDAEPMQTVDLPVILAPMLENASIRLEPSSYVSPENVPMAIAVKGASCPSLGELDRAAWVIPESFLPGHLTVLSSGLDHVMITLENYSITYGGLHGAENPNPEHYTLSDLPIALEKPGTRVDYAFVGWYDADGRRVTEIQEGMTGNIALFAVWEKLSLSFDGNAPCACNIPDAIYSEGGGALVPIVIPYRPRWRFMCWNMPDSGSGKVYFPGDTVLLSESNVTLYAQWTPDCEARKIKQS